MVGWFQSARIRRISERKRIHRSARVEREGNKRVLDSEIISCILSFSRPVFRIRFVLTVSLLSVPPPLSDPCGDFISFLFSTFLILLQQRHGDFPPSSTSGTLAIPGSLALSPRFFPSSLDSDALSPAPTRRPKLESNFPHHIPQKLLRGGAGSSATHSSCTKERRNIFIFSLLFYPLLSLPLSLLPSPSCRPK